MRAWLRERPWWLSGGAVGLWLGLVGGVQAAFHERAVVAVAVAVGVVGAVVSGFAYGLLLRWNVRHEPAELRSFDRARRRAATKAAGSRKAPTDPRLRSDAAIVLRHQVVAVALAPAPVPPPRSVRSVRAVPAG